MSSISEKKKDLETAVREIYAKVKQERRKLNFDRLRDFLKRERDQVLQQTQRPPQALLNDDLPTTDENPSDAEEGRKRRFKVTQTTNSGGGPESERTFTSSVRSEILPQQDPLPDHLVFLPIIKNHRVWENNDVAFVPYLGENQKDDVNVLSEHEVSSRMRRITEGPECLGDEKDELLDEVLRQCSQITMMDVWKDEWATSVVLSCIADRSRTECSRVQNRYNIVFKKERRKINSEHASMSSFEHPGPKSASGGGKKDVDETTLETAGGLSHQEGDSKIYCQEIHPQQALDTRDKEYMEALDSYRVMYCRRCFTFQCNLHGSPLKPSLAFQHERAREMILDGVWSPMGLNVPKPGAFKFDEVKELSTFHKMMCKRMFLLYEGNFEEMSNALCAPVHLLLEFVDQEGYTLPTKPPGPRAADHQKNLFRYSVKHYKPKWYSAIEKAEIHPFFEPCTHEEPCSDATCTCVQSRMFCTRACCWGTRSPNFFRGCGCKGACIWNNCTCFATKRECDPDLCGCNPCSDPPNGPAVTQQCRNDNLRMRRHAHLLLAPSEVSGWGIYTKHDIKKGDFIHEYTGELITQEEAERRGQVADIKNRSYLFNLSSDHVLDAYRQGSKARFMNHSETPNCASRTLFVNGDQRIGFFACEDIKAESELFFDYRYNVTMSNDLIEKCGKTFDWMKSDERKKPASKAKKKASKKRKR